MPTDPRAMVNARVDAMGGVFIATEDAPRLIRWYRELGIPIGEEGHCVLGAEGDAASPADGAVFSIMPARDLLPAQDDDLSEEPYGRRRITLNLRVRGLDQVLAALAERGSDVAGPRDYVYGRFAWTRDPDGNLVELWEPSSAGPPPVP